MTAFSKSDSVKKSPALQGDGSLLYLIDDDELFAAELVASLELANYHVRHFTVLSDFIAACEKETPAAIIVDIVLSGRNALSTEIVSRLKAKIEVCPPVVFISARDDIEVRLAAVRLGARRYFCKPLDMKPFIQALNDLTMLLPVKPYRVLLVDDDEITLQLYATMLREAGMDVETLSDPLLCLKTLAKFSPDILIADVYMAGCSGTELAQVVRQDNAFARMPIIFLSGEQDTERQLTAMTLGGDDFLVKPVAADHLVTVVIARAKRARWINQLNDGLESALRESEFQLITMDQHNIVSATDIDGRIISVNDKFCEISGYSREELLGQNHRVLKSSLHSSSFYEELWRTISQGKVWNGIICNRKKNGEEYWVESSIVPFLDEKGKPYKYVSARTDITALRQSEERLYRSQLFANIGTWDWDLVTDKLYWSELIGPLFGYEKGELETSYENFIEAVHPEDRQAVTDAVNDCMELGIAYNIEHRVVWPNGSVHWILERGDVIRSEEGEPLHMMGVVQDITERKHIELALADSELLLREAQVLAKMGHWQANIVTGGLSWSDDIYRIFGYEPGSIKPSVEVFRKAVHPDDVELVHKSEKRAEQTGLHDVVHRIVRPDGTVRHVHELAQAETDATGKIIRLTGTVQDISELMEAKNRLQESEERFAFAVEGAGDGVWEWDIRTNSLGHSRLTVEMLGYKDGEFPPSLDGWIDILHPDDKVRVTQKVKEFLVGQAPLYIMEQRLRCKDGSYKWILSRGTVVERDENGKPTRMIGIHSDITERVESENTLRRYNDILELIAKGRPLTDILTAVAVHAETMLSGGLCSILLLDHSGKYLVDGIAPSLPDFYNKAIDGLEIGMGVGSCGESAFSGERVIVGDVMKHPNWTAFRELAQKAGLRACWSEPVFSSSGIVLGTFAIYYPAPREPKEVELKITRELAQFVAIVVERSLVQQALVVAKDEAEKANHAKSQFLSNMSHELRTPMNAIMGFGQLLKMETDSALTEVQQENVDEIIKASTHLLEIINEVLDLAKIEAGRIDLSIEAVILDEVIAESLQLIMPLAQKRDIETSLTQDGVEISYEQLLRQHNVVRADRIRLKQVLLNLLSNAVKYNSKNGKLIIACNAGSDNQVRISVTDTGSGLTRKQQSQLFKAFNRLAPEQSTIEGTGIGLVLARNIVELMGGSIGVDSQPGEGSTFWIELPGDVLHAVQKKEPDKKQTTQTPVITSSEHEYTVLYIEDNPANLRLVAQLLGRSSNVHMWSAHTPLLGLELAAEHNPDLILLDINLPGMNGFEVLDLLRQCKTCGDTPVIAISANAMPQNIEHGLAAGFDAYITKPIDVSNFLHVVDAVLMGENSETRAD